MAPRKRQRKRQASVSSSSSEASSSSDEEEQVLPPSKIPTPQANADASSSSSEASSSSSEDSSEEDEKTKRRGRNARINPNSVQGKAAALSASTTSATPAANQRRPYPSRSPSPVAFNPANIPLGANPFPLLRALKAGPILSGFVPGDQDFIAPIVGSSLGSLDKGKAVEKEGMAKLSQEASLAKEAQFGEWWRARLVSEFEKELGGLAAEPGLTAPRLSLLLTALTTLSSLHTTSSTLATTARSIWLHDPLAAIDPLAGLEIEEDDTPEWGKTVVGGEGDVEVGAEGVGMDQVQEMEVDE